MNTIICKMCGNTQLTNINGVYRCPYCGTCYEAFNKQSFRSDKNHTDNLRISPDADTNELLRLAQEALKSNFAGAKQYAKAYCARAFEQAPTNYKVLCLYAEILITEANFSYNLISQLSDFIQRCPCNQKKAYLEHIRLHFGTSLLDLVRVSTCDYEKLGYQYEADKVIAAITKIHSIEAEFFSKHSIKLIKEKNEAMNIVLQSVQRKWNTIQLKYDNAGQYPDEHAWRHYIDDGITAADLLNNTADILNIINSDICAVICNIYKAVLLSYAWDSKYINDRKTWFTTLHLSKAAISSILATINSFLNTLEKSNPNASSHLKSCTFLTLPEVILARELNAGATTLAAIVTAMKEAHISKQAAKELLPSVRSKLRPGQKQPKRLFVIGIIAILLLIFSITFFAGISSKKNPTQSVSSAHYSETKDKVVWRCSGQADFYELLNSGIFTTEEDWMSPLIHEHLKIDQLIEKNLILTDKYIYWGDLKYKYEEAQDNHNLWLCYAINAEAAFGLYIDDTENLFLNSDGMIYHYIKSK